MSMWRFYTEMARPKEQQDDRDIGEVVQAHASDQSAHHTIIVDQDRMGHRDISEVVQAYASDPTCDFAP